MASSRYNAAVRASRPVGSVTVTQDSRSTPQASSSSRAPPQDNLRLQVFDDTPQPVEEDVEQRRVEWNDDVIDNEDMGKKSSKICCIYHRPKADDELSSSESPSDSSTGSDSEPESSRPPRGPNRGRDPHDHCADHDHDHDHDHAHITKKNKQPDRKRSPNAYERMPKPRKKKPIT